MSYHIISLAHFEDLKGTILDVLHTAYDTCVIIIALMVLKLRGGGGQIPSSPRLNRFKTGFFVPLSNGLANTNFSSIPPIVCLSLFFFHPIICLVLVMTTKKITENKSF